VIGIEKRHHIEIMHTRGRRILEGPHHRDDIGGCWSLEPRIEPILDARKDGFRVLRVNFAARRYGARQKLRFPSVDAPFQARENVGIVAARGRMLSSVRPWMRHEHSRRPVWEFADRVQITRSVLEAQWKALVVPAPSRRLLRHTLLPLALTSSRSRSAYAAAAGAL
jgi:hypothetical protein